MAFRGLPRRALRYKSSRGLPRSGLFTSIANAKNNHMGHGQYILAEDGKTPVPCEDTIAWGHWFQAGTDRRRVAKDTIDGVDVSTVFLGLDHRHMGEGPPLLFETMIFGGKHDQYCDRYSTYDEAIEGHKRAVAMLFEV